jgi:hypothetical protein
LIWRCIALDFRAWLGGERAINDYCHALALSGGRKLAQILGTQMMDESEDAEGVANMVRSANITPRLEHL